MKGVGSLVSIVVTNYNYGEYIDNAIQSALNQSYENIELIVINDGSTDDSLVNINKHKDDARVKVINHENKGIVYVRNEGLKESRGEYICFLDADDCFDFDYIEKMLGVAKQSNADVIYPNWRIFGEREDKTNFQEFDIHLLVTQQIHCTAESLIRRDSIGSHKFESEKVAEDWDFFLGLALDGRNFKLASDCFINYRMHKGSRGSARSIWDDMYYFYEILQKWNKRYPNKIRPIDLPIALGKQREARIEEQDKLLEERAEAVHSKERERAKAVEDLNSIANSTSFRLSQKMASSFRFIKLFKRK